MLSARYHSGSQIKANKTKCTRGTRKSDTKFTYSLFAGKTEAKISIPRRRLRRKYNIKINFKYVKSERVRYIKLTQDRDQSWAVANTVMNIRVR